MTISSKDWNYFVARLARINETSARKMGQYLQTHGYDNTQALIDYAYGLATKYGEASAALSAEWYDAIAALTRAPVPPAVPAATATYEEVSHAVIGVVERSQNEDMLTGAVSRLVKQAGADTTVQNALRDRALWAWIPSGDTCAFCLALAANGWQRASGKTLRGNHASHIHANCNCTFAIQFDGKPAYAGYDPDRYREIYDNAAGGSAQDKINAMRRAQYARDKDEINAQKRIAYRERTDKTPIIPVEKFTEYALSPQAAPDKAKAFERALGYTQANYQGLIDQISKQVSLDKCRSRGHNDFGELYEQVMRITGVNGKSANVCTGWIRQNGSDRLALTSAYVTKKKVTSDV